MIEQGVSLKTYNSFGVDAEASLFAVAKTINDLQSILKDQRFASAWILVAAIHCFVTPPNTQSFTLQFLASKSLKNKEMRSSSKQAQG